VDAYRIRSYPCPLDDIDPAPFGHKWTIFEGSRGTCATPLYFSPLKIPSGHSTFTFQDAGYSGFNNPAKIAIDEAEKLFGDDATITLVSLGTGLRSLVERGQYRSGTKTGLRIKDEDVTSSVQQILASVGERGAGIEDATRVAKRVAKQLLEVANDTEISHLRMYEEFERQDQEGNYHRFNPPQGLGDIELADCSKEVDITETTRAWLNSADGERDVSVIVKNMKHYYELTQP
ncbi:hypothetical protein BJ138DRAFT_1120334, partial [Hygrophoropsis aurantiaca]